MLDTNYQKVKKEMSRIIKKMFNQIKIDNLRGPVQLLVKINRSFVTNYILSKIFTG